MQESGRFKYKRAPPLDGQRVGSYQDGRPSLAILRIADKGVAGFDAEEFGKLKAMASDSVARLEGNAVISSSVDMDSVKSLSSKLHLCRPYSSDA